MQSFSFLYLMLFSICFAYLWCLNDTIGLLMRIEENTRFWMLSNFPTTSIPTNSISSIGKDVRFSPEKAGFNSLYRSFFASKIVCVGNWFSKTKRQKKTCIHKEHERVIGLVVWFLFWVQEVSGSIPESPHFWRMLSFAPFILRIWQRFLNDGKSWILFILFILFFTQKKIKYIKQVTTTCLTTTKICWNWNQCMLKIFEIKF